MFRLLGAMMKSVLGVATCGVALRLLVPFVKSILGITQFAVLSRLAEQSGLRDTWIEPMARRMSPAVGLNEGYLEILIVATISFWAMCLISALCRSLSTALRK